MPTIAKAVLSDRLNQVISPSTAPTAGPMLRMTKK